jgi:hypothetical protein
MAVTSMSASSIGNGQERYNRVSGVNNNLDWCRISTTPSGSYTDADGVWDYWIFKSNSSLTVSKGGLIDFLVVGGGASGGSNNATNYAGGGGAGGCRVPFPGETITAGTYPVTIGAGGAETVAAGNGNSGNDSLIGTTADVNIVGVGGGYGASRYQSGGDGGSGGGGGQYLTSQYTFVVFPGAGTYYQGFPGGYPVSDGHYAGGGGGGGEAGENGGTTIDPGSAGGNGLITTIIPTSVATAQSIGEVDTGNLYFAGGGGRAYNGPGGLGGGTDGAPSGGRSTSAPANTGGGSGSGDINLGTPYSGAGGSGVVIVRTRA